jgi:glycosyltransferase involved in cell wall biosynthesis
MESKYIQQFSVIMPTYNQSSFIRRAILSLQNQTYKNWELIIVNDGCKDNTEDVLSDFLTDERIRYIKNEKNQGLGYALNQGLEASRCNYIAYLPSDDFYYENHLELIKKKYEEKRDLLLVFSGIKVGARDSLVSNFAISDRGGLLSNYPLQLVQVTHRKTTERWIERKEWLSEDLFQMFWRKLLKHGIFARTNEITCHWTAHPYQRHKILGEKYGGNMNFYRQYYQVKEPVKIKISPQKTVDEVEIYKSFRKKCPRDRDSLKILLVGELAYNAERIYALEEAGHRLYGLWMQRPAYVLNTVGPLPFGNVQDVPYENWRESVNKIKPDIIYGLLNAGAIPLAHEIVTHTEIPFVWHFKEGPSFAMTSGLWPLLMDLYHKSDGKIFINEENQCWYKLFIRDMGLTFTLDGDLPKANYFTNDFSPLLSNADNAIHTVIAGRPIGIGLNEIKLLSDQNIHIHLYNENYVEVREPFIKSAMTIAPKHIHLHNHCKPQDWVKEFSRYDAGWLHCFHSSNEGDLFKANWDDLNLPARMNTLAAAGIPMLQMDNSKHLVAMQSHVKKYDMGVFINKWEELGAQFQNKDRIKQLRENAIKNRKYFSFDHYVPDLISFFRKVINEKQRKNK